MNVLGIETSCDETAAGVVGGPGLQEQDELVPAAGEQGGLLVDVTYSQQVHAEFGGVVPELASRAHLEKIVPTVSTALRRAGILRPDAVAVTAGPGLMGAVLVGLSFAKAAAMAWGVPVLGVNHLEGHALSPFIGAALPRQPFLALVVSGGHSSLYRVAGVGSYECLARTVDDAAGEAFDKVARMLGLGYPGGPLIDHLARQGDASAVPFPRPKAPGLDMSFSGLKTAVRTWLEKHPDTPRADVAASFQEAVVDVLLDRLGRAALDTGLDVVAVSGGVASNTRFRQRLQSSGMDLRIPPARFCTDNGAMIAHAGRLGLLAGRRSPPDLGVRAVWPLGSASSSGLST